MTTVEALNAKNKLRALLDRVERGEEVVVTRHGKPVAWHAWFQNGERVDRSEARAALGRIRSRAAAVAMQSFDWSSRKNDQYAGQP